MARAVLTPNAWLRWDLIDRSLRSAPPTSILELGMGQGAVGSRLAERAAYTGIEPDAASRAVAVNRLPAGARAFAHLDELAADEQFDLVCAFEVLEHIEDDVAALASWATRVAPGGRLLLSVPAHEHRFAAADELVGHHRRYGREQLSDLVRSTGLVVDGVEAFGFPLGYALEAGRNLLARRRAATTPSSIEDRTAASGRTFQPPTWAGAVTQAATAPFRLVQRSFTDTERATGWLLHAHQPRP